MTFCSIIAVNLILSLLEFLADRRQKYIYIEYNLYSFLYLVLIIIIIIIKMMIIIVIIMLQNFLSLAFLYHAEDKLAI